MASFDNYKKAFSGMSGKSRLMFGLVLFGGLGLVAYSLGGKNDIAQTNVSVPNDVVAVKGSDISGEIKNKEHKELLIESEKKRVAEAKNENRSSVAPITGLEENLLKKKPEKAAVPAQQPNQVVYQQQMTARQQQIDAINRQIKEMRDREAEIVQNAINNVFKTTEINSHKVYNFGSSLATEAIQSAGNENGDIVATAEPAPAKSPATEPASTEEEPHIVVGSIVTAVLDMKANSDTPTPIRARVVDGPLKGAVLVGSFESFEESLVLKFNTITKGGKVASVDVVAIDPSISSAAIATDVNHHYLYRYGMLMGATFLDGVATAISDSGTTVTITPSGPVTSTAPVIDVNKQMWAGAAAVGSEIAGIAKEEFKIPNTVIVDKGTLLGIMFVNSANDKWLPFIRPDK